MERLGVAATLVPALVLGAIVTATLAYAATSVATMSTALFLIGLFVGLGASGSIALAALIYPAAIRSSGVGWAMGMGRFGQVLAPLFAGAVLALGWSNADLFMAIGLAPLIGAAALLALRSSGRGGAAPVRSLPRRHGHEIAFVSTPVRAAFRSPDQPGNRERGDGRNFQSDVDLFDDASLVDPFDDYRRLRDLGPVVKLARPDVYALARFDDVRDALRASDRAEERQGRRLQRCVQRGRARTQRSAVRR